MPDLKEKAAYLRGLIDGTDVLQNEKEKMIWEGLLGFCDAVAGDFADQDESHLELAEYVEAIDEDLSSLEKYFYSDEDGDDEPEVIVSESDNEFNTMEMSCPNCKEVLCFEDEPGNYEVVCPECGVVIWNHFEMEPESLQRPYHDVI